MVGWLIGWLVGWLIGGFEITGGTRPPPCSPPLKSPESLRLPPPEVRKCTCAMACSGVRVPEARGWALLSPYSYNGDVP